MNDDQMLAYLDDADAGLIPKAGLAPVRDHMKTLIAERDRLRAIVEAVAYNGESPITPGEERIALRVLARSALDGQETVVEYLKAERDRLRAVVERFQEANAATLAACTSDQSTAALEEYRAAVDALLELDGSGITGAGSGPDDAGDGERS